MNNDYVKEVAGRIIEQMKQGTAPWQKPWKAGELRLPYNAATGKEYRGMNSLWLHMQGYADPRWMTFRQANEAGAQVRKGSKGTRVVYWKFFDDVPLKDDNGRPVLDEDGKPKTVRVELEKPRVFGAVVFNAEQIEGLPALEAKATGPEPERHARAEAILANSGATIEHFRGASPSYFPKADKIALPHPDQFISPDAYYATALHELGHWTGHPSRLDRDLSHPFGSAGYAKEELRAEIASLMLGERLEIGHDPGQHVAYVASWIKILEDDPREIFRAASDAERITRYVMEFELEQQAVAPDVAPEIGERVTFTPYEASATEQAVTGVVVDIASTSGGNRRYRIRTDEIAPQDGDRQEWLVYSHQGTFERHLAHVAPAMAPDVAKALELDHQNAVPTYSPLETWQNLEASARQLGLVASIRLNPETDVAAGHSRYLVSYSRDTGEPTTISTGIFPDGKAVTGVLNRRVSAFITEDHDSQRDDLQTALTHENARARPVLHGAPEASAMTQTRTYLAVPYREKNAAKSLGAKWDKEAKVWYAPEGVDVLASGLAKWLPEQQATQPAEVDPPQVAFAAALQAAGLEVKGDPIMDGNLHRVPVKGDRGGQTSGAYVGHLEGRCPAGFIQNYRTGERVNWKHEGPVSSISAEDRARLDREAAERLERRAVQVAAEYERVSQIANVLWNEAPSASADHLYCSAKGIERPGEHGLRVVPSVASDAAKSAGVRIAKSVKQARAMREAEPDARVFIAGDLLVPLMDLDGKIWSLQTINPRFKGYVKGGRKAGLFTVAGAKPEEYLSRLASDPSTPLVQAEGYATADTVARLTDRPVIVAFDSGNLQAVAEQFRERYPERAILIASDNDHKSARQLRPDGTPMPNVGVEKAKATAEAIGAGVMVPPFAEVDDGSDWNDFFHQYGESVARRALTEELAKAKVEAAVNLERRQAADNHKENERADHVRQSVAPAPKRGTRGHVAAL